MNTSAEAIRLLENARAQADTAIGIIENLIAPHDYQDVASLVAQAAASLLEASSLLLQSNDVAAFAALDRADDLLDAMVDIINADMEDE